MQEAAELMRVALRTVMLEAYEMGVIVGEKQMECAELRATIATLNDQLREAEAARFTVVYGGEATD